MKKEAEEYIEYGNILKELNKKFVQKPSEDNAQKIVNFVNEYGSYIKKEDEWRNKFLKGLCVLFSFITFIVAMNIDDDPHILQIKFIVICGLGGIVFCITEYASLFHYYDQIVSNKEYKADARAEFEKIKEAHTKTIELKSKYLDEQNNSVAIHAF